MKMLVKHHAGRMSIEAKTPRKAAEKLVAMGIEEATLIEATRPHIGRVLRIKEGEVRLIR